MSELNFVEDTPLSTGEAETLASLEETIQRGACAWIEAVQALSVIRDRRLYRATHKTFEEYCTKRWGWVASRARQLIGAVETLADLRSVTMVTLPMNERQLRPLVPLNTKDRKEVWEMAVDSAGGTPTGKDVEKAVSAVVARKVTPAVKPEPVPHVIAAWHREPSDDDDLGDEEEDGYIYLDAPHLLRCLKKIPPREQPESLFGRFCDDSEDLDRFIHKEIDLDQLASDWPSDAIEEIIGSLCIARNTLDDFRQVLQEIIDQRQEPRS